MIDIKLGSFVKKGHNERLNLSLNLFNDICSKTIDFIFDTRNTNSIYFFYWTEEHIRRHYDYIMFRLYNYPLFCAIPILFSTEIDFDIYVNKYIIIPSTFLLHYKDNYKTSLLNGLDHIYGMDFITSDLYGIKQREYIENKLKEFGFEYNIYLNKNINLRNDIRKKFELFQGEY